MPCYRHKTECMMRNNAIPFGSQVVQTSNEHSSLGEEVKEIITIVNAKRFVTKKRNYNEHTRQNIREECSLDYSTASVMATGICPLLHMYYIAMIRYGILKCRTHTL